MELVKVTIDALSPALVIVDMVIHHYKNPELIVIRFAIHIKIYVFTILFLRNQKEAIHSHPVSNKWLDREIK